MKGRISKWLPCETGEARTWTLSPIGSLLRSRSSWGPQRPDLARPDGSSAGAGLEGPRADYLYWWMKIPTEANAPITVTAGGKNWGERGRRRPPTDSTADPHDHSPAPPPPPPKTHR